MTNTKIPNIFTYATHELSQDAFICYWLEYARKEYENLPLFKLAQKLLQKLGIFDECVLSNPERQQKKMDALVETKNHYIIIEDKISSYEHNHQILRYIKKLKEKIKNENKEQKDIICVYFKTGFLPQQEKNELDKLKTEIQEKEKVKLVIIGLEDLLDENQGLLSDDVSEFQIFQMFKEKLILNQEYIKKSKTATSFKTAEDKSIFLDTLTEIIRENTAFKKASWFITGPQHTAHISLFCVESKKIKDLKLYYEMFIMFRKSCFQFVIKEAIYNIIDDDHKKRVLIENYEKLPYEIREIQDRYKKCIKSFSGNGFEDVDKDKLMLLKKVFPDIETTKENILDKIKENFDYLKEIQENLSKVN